MIFVIKNLVSIVIEKYRHFVVGKRTFSVPNPNKFCMKKEKKEEK